MEYKTVLEAKNARGLRLVLPKGVPGPWSESAKSIFSLNKVSFIPVAQYVGEENAELVGWTGFRNAPIAVLDSEKPLDRWLDILMLAERLSPEPKLLPVESRDRALAIGICNEICGEWGLGWCRRLMLLDRATSPANADIAPNESRLRAEYFYSSASSAVAPLRCAQILNMLTACLKDQRARGSAYLVGESLTAADIYWATFSTIVEPLPESLSPMPDWQRRKYSAVPPILEAAKDPILFEHRDRVFSRYLRLPVEC